MNYEIVRYKKAILAIRLVFILAGAWSGSFSLSLYGISSPVEAPLLSQGVFGPGPSWLSFSLGYQGYYTFDQPFEDEFNLPGCIPSTSHLRMYTNSAEISCHLQKRCSFYSLLGSSRLQVDEEVFANTHFSWKIGAKVVLLSLLDFSLGADISYFETESSPLYFVCDQQAYELTTPYTLRLTKTEAVLSLAYLSNFVSPYLGCSYSIARIEPIPSSALVRLPTEPIEVDISSKSIRNRERLGGLIGISWIDSSKAMFSFEYRGWNEQSILGSFIIRF
jgi:hypothetical protein